MKTYPKARWNSTKNPTTYVTPNKGSRATMLLRPLLRSLKIWEALLKQIKLNVISLVNKTYKLVFLIHKTDMLLRSAIEISILWRTEKTTVLIKKARHHLSTSACVEQPVNAMVVPEPA